MIDTTKELYEDTKKSLESLLHEKAYSDVQEILEEKGININDVNDEDIETLVAAKAQDMMNGIKGFSVGTAFALALSLLIGV
jgi:hypothetical protein